MARSKEQSQQIAIKTNVTKWINAISKQSGDKPIYDVLGIEKSVWDSYSFSDKWSLIDTFKKDHKEFHLERNNKNPKNLDYKSLAFQLISPDLSPEDREKAINNVSLVKAYEEATNEFKKAKNALNAAQSAYDNAKTKLKIAKANLDKAKE